MENEVQNHTFSILVENESGVLARVIGLLSGRGYNIDSLTVSEIDTENRLSKITIVSSGTRMVLGQIRAQLERLVPVRAVADLTVEGPSVERELALIKVAGDKKKLTQSVELAESFKANIVDSTSKSYVFEVVNSVDKINELIDLMMPLGLVDVSRTGVVAISRGARSI